MTRSLTDAQVTDEASAHDGAYRSATPIDPPSRRHPDMTLDDAYAIQRAWVEQQLFNGASVFGRKVGLTSRAMQQAMKIDEPDFGTLLDHMEISPGSTVATAELLDPKIEVELAFVLAHDLDGDGLTAADVLAATDHVVPALELIDARSHRVHPADGHSRTVRDTIADNAANRGVVVGGERRPPSAVDLPWVGAVLSRHDVVEETGLAAGVLGDPVRGVVWLANRVAALGIPLRAGETILSGSFTRPLDCRAGDRFRADYGPLGVIEIAFS